jgi:hypothetical protein
MHQPAVTTPTPSPPAFPGPTFANLLASFAAPGQRRPPALDLDGLEDDVATLSYERALRVHARYRPPDNPDRSPAHRPDHAGDSSHLRIFEVLAASAEPAEPILQPAPEELLTSMNQEALPPEAFPQPAFPQEAFRQEPFGQEPSPQEPFRQEPFQQEPFQQDHFGQGVFRQEALPPEAVPQPAFSPVEVEARRESPSALDRNLKSASITVRLSKSECEQLRQRAEEAGLTVSAYMRSCTFEAETLRALVKDTLARLRSESGKENAPAAAKTRKWRQRFAWLWPHPRARVASA